MSYFASTVKEKVKSGKATGKVRIPVDSNHPSTAHINPAVRLHSERRRKNNGETLAFRFRPVFTLRASDSPPPPG